MQELLKKTIETIQSSITLQDDNELVVALNANKTYGFMLLIFYNSGTTPDFDYAFTAPTDATGFFTNSNITADAAALNADLTTENFCAGNVSNKCSVNFGQITNLTNAGNFTVQWAQNVSTASDTSVLVGSYLIVWEET